MHPEKAEKVLKQQHKIRSLMGCCFWLWENSTVAIIPTRKSLVDIGNINYLTYFSVITVKYSLSVQTFEYKINFQMKCIKKIDTINDI